jgi:hypothetical protein
MKLYQRGQSPVPPADKEAAKQVLTARMQADLRIGESLEARMNWLLTFVQRDLDRLSPGDWLDLCHEIRMYGSPLPASGSGLYSFQVPYGNTPQKRDRHSLLPRKGVRNVQHQLLHLMQDLLGGQMVVTVPLSIRLTMLLHPRRSSVDSAWTGHPFHLLLFRLTRDLLTADVARIRQCVLGKSTEYGATGVQVCGRWFYANDLRQHYCSSACSKEGRWTRYWHANRERINQRRRKGS